MGFDNESRKPQEGEAQHKTHRHVHQKTLAPPDNSKIIRMRCPNLSTLCVKSLVVDGREGSKILLSSLRSMEVVSQSEGRWFDVRSLLLSSFQTTSKVASTAASRVSRSEGKSGCWGRKKVKSNVDKFSPGA